MALSIRQYPLLKDETGLLVSNTIGLFLRLTQQHFSNGRLKVSKAYNFLKAVLQKITSGTCRRLKHRLVTVCNTL